MDRKEKIETVCIAIIALSALSLVLFNYQGYARQGQDDICWLELYNSNASRYGMMVPAYDAPIFYNIWYNTTDGESWVKNDCQILEDNCMKPKHQEALGCRWLSNDRICECDFKRAVSSYENQTITFI